MNTPPHTSPAPHAGTRQPYGDRLPDDHQFWGLRTGILLTCSDAGTRSIFSEIAGVAHFLADGDDPAGIVATLAGALAPGGGFVAISHLTADFAPEQVGAGVAAYNTLVSDGITARTHREVTGLFGGLSLVAPGVVPVSEWRPEHAPVRGVSADMYCGLATVTGRLR
jgi:S-adenosyl methyltransferase